MQWRCTVCCWQFACSRHPPGSLQVCCHDTPAAHRWMAYPSQCCSYRLEGSRHPAVRLTGLPGRTGSRAAVAKPLPALLWPPVPQVTLPDPGAGTFHTSAPAVLLLGQRCAARASSEQCWCTACCHLQPLCLRTAGQPASTWPPQNQYVTASDATQVQSGRRTLCSLLLTG
jgi:hypothetical protein